jgi:phage major head subunit gpT-like protein
MPAINDKVTLFTAAMRNEFMTSYDAFYTNNTMVPWQGFVTTIPSTARVEHYPFLSPPPRLRRWMGKRNYTAPGWTKYKVENIEFSAEEKVYIRDIEDDQTGGYKGRMQMMAQDAMNHPGREAMKLLRDNGTCFDGSNFFADSHTIGTGDNNLTFDAASNDGATHTVVSLLKVGSVKPVIWQQRKDKGLNDNSGTKESEEAKEIRYWYDYEGAAAFGYWWTAVKTTVTDTPTVNEVETILKNIEAAFRGFKLDKADAADDDWWPHEQLVFGLDTICHVVNPAIENVFRTVLTTENIQAGTSGGTKTNIYRGHGDLLISPYFGA